MTEAVPEISFEACEGTEAHARLVMAWRNDPEALAASFHGAPKVWDAFWQEYREDYVATGLCPGPVFALEQGQRVAFLRFRPAPNPRALAGRTVDLSINVAPEARGRGVGTRAVRAALSHLAGRDVDTVVAEVRTGNDRSCALFESAGFERLGPTTRTVPDTGERAEILRFVAELTPAFWRSRPVFVIAEAGSNWRLGEARRDLAMGRALIDVAAEAGADAVKFQTYRPESVYVPNAGQSAYLAEAGIEEDISTIFSDLAMPYEMLPLLAEHCRSRGVAFMSTPFSPQDFEAIDPHVQVHKIASYEIAHLRLLELAGRSGKPLVLSTGASSPSDVEWAARTFAAAGGRDLCLLQCTAKYPAPPSSLNLAAIADLRRRFGVATGLSDHSREPALAPVMAVALGARVVEKHFTLDNRLPGPDHAFALMPDELARMVREIRLAEEALGDGFKRVLPDEAELASYARRGLQATAPIRRGETLRENENIAILRPGQQKLGAHPRHLGAIEGRRASRDIAAGEGVSPEDAVD